MTSQTLTPDLIVHGGAGLFYGDRHEAASEGCRRAALRGLAILAAGGSALDAAQAATRELEDEPSLNAGTGASLTRSGTIEVDAAIMDGATLRVGGVASLENCGRAIEVARAVLEDGRHALLCGQGAWDFARDKGFSPDDPQTLIQDYRRRQLEEKRAEGGGTVGACAVDSNGHVAAATSTGGTTGKLPGRIGDTPLPGCGTFADPVASASATGHGEALMKTTMTRFCTDRCHDGASAQQAAQLAVEEVDCRVGGDAGIIVATAEGGVGAAHNTTEMPFAAGVVIDGVPRLLASGIRLPSDLDFEALLDRARLTP